LLTTVPMRMMKPSMARMSKAWGAIKGVHQPQADEASGRRQGNGEQDDQGIQEIFEQGGHQQVGYQQGQQQVPFQGSPGFYKLVGIAADPDLDVFKLTGLSQGADDIGFDDLHGLLQGQCPRWGHLEADGPDPFQVVDLGHARTVLETGDIPDPDQVAVVVDDGGVENVLRGCKVPVFSFQDQVDLLDPLRPVLVHLPAIHQDVDIDPQVLLAQAVGGQFFLIGDNPHFRVAGFQRGDGADLAIGRFAG
jgi:hypothetical protein